MSITSDAWEESNERLRTRLRKLRDCAFAIVDDTSGAAARDKLTELSSRPMTPLLMQQIEALRVAHLAEMDAEAEALRVAIAEADEVLGP